MRIYGAKTNKLPDGLYPRGLIVHQQRFQPGDSNTNKYIFQCTQHLPGINLHRVHSKLRCKMQYFFKNHRIMCYLPSSVFLINVINKTKIILLQSQETLANVGFSLWFLPLKPLFYLASHRLILSLNDEGYSRNPPYGLTLISTFFYYNIDQFIIDVIFVYGSQVIHLICTFYYIDQCIIVYKQRSTKTCIQK